MKVKTSELEGATLDWSVAKALGAKVYRRARFTNFGEDMERFDWFAAPIGWWADSWRPSSDWSQGGPLIAKKITVLIDCEAGCYADTRAKAGIYGQAFSEYDGHGPSLLVAAMRAIVASEIGDEVDVPDELAAGR